LPVLGRRWLRIKVRTELARCRKRGVERVHGATNSQGYQRLVKGEHCTSKKIKKSRQGVWAKGSLGRWRAVIADRCEGGPGYKMEAHI